MWRNNSRRPFLARQPVLRMTLLGNCRVAVVPRWLTAGTSISADPYGNRIRRTPRQQQHTLLPQREDGVMRNVCKCGNIRQYTTIETARESEARHWQAEETSGKAGGMKKRKRTSHFSHKRLGEKTAFSKVGQMRQFLCQTNCLALCTLAAGALSFHCQTPTIFGLRVLTTLLGIVRQKVAVVQLRHGLCLAVLVVVGCHRWLLRRCWDLRSLGPSTSDSIVVLTVTRNLGSILAYHVCNCTSNSTLIPSSSAHTHNTMSLG